MDSELTRAATEAEWTAPELFDAVCKQALDEDYFPKDKVLNEVTKKRLLDRSFWDSLDKNDVDTMLAVGGAVVRDQMVEDHEEMSSRAKKPRTEEAQ